MHANKREEIASVGAGEIVAVMGLKDTTTGHTLCDPSNPVVLESMTFPAPVIEVAIEPKTKGDQDKLGTAIQRLSEEDPTFRSRPTRRPARRSSPAWASCTSRSSSTACARVQASRRTSASRRWPTARRSPRRSRTTSTRTRSRPVVRVSSPRSWSSLEPNIDPETGLGAGYEFVQQVTGGRIPREYIPSVDQGGQDAMEFGVLAGYPMVDVKVTLEDGAYHDVDSSELAFKIAGNDGLQGGRTPMAKPVLLEPMLAVEVTTPEDFMGTSSATSTPAAARSRPWRSATATWSSRRWCRCRRCSGTLAICGRRPQGQASYSMEFDSYAEVPTNIADEIIKKVRGE
jgi:elongation factor G